MKKLITILDKIFVNYRFSLSIITILTAVLTYYIYVKTNTILFAIITLSLLGYNIISIIYIYIRKLIIYINGNKNNK